MQIAESELDGLPVLRPAGALRTAADAGALDERLRALLEGGAASIVVDCTAVTTLGSPAVRSLLRASQRLRSQGGALVLLRLGERVRRALEVSGFDKEFALAGSEAAVPRVGAVAHQARAVSDAEAAPRPSDPWADTAAALLRLMTFAVPPPSIGEADRERLRPAAQRIRELLEASRSAPPLARG